jgi:hypothetical protein
MFKKEMQYIIDLPSRQVVLSCLSLSNRPHFKEVVCSLLRSLNDLLPAYVLSPLKNFNDTQYDTSSVSLIRFN